eukprot:s1379_g8.t1
MDLLWGPPQHPGPVVPQICPAWTNNLREYFEKHYREGGEFHHGLYVFDGTSEEWWWTHKPTGIHVWRDAIDLTKDGQGGQVFFHYTSEFAFRNITCTSKEAAEIWASLRTEGPNANAWWGKGIYTVPFPPDQWQSCKQLLDNNFRNMMQRDRESEDPEKGPAYVDREYPKRAAFCVPILIDPINAFDVSIRATPEMEAAGKEPGRNLGNKLLNEPGKPPRSCVVLRVSGEDGVQGARSHLLKTLRARASASGDCTALWRLCSVLDRRGFHEEAAFVAKKMVASSELTHGPMSHHTFACRSMLQSIQVNLPNCMEDEKSHREVFFESLKMWGFDDPRTLSNVENLAVCLSRQMKCSEAVELFRQILEARERTLGPDDCETLATLANLAITLTDMGTMSSLEEALLLHRKAAEARTKKLGAEHPETLQSLSHLAVALHDTGDLSEALALQRRVLEARERLLGPQHPSTIRSIQRLVDVLNDLGETAEAAELKKRLEHVEIWP